MLLEEQHFSDHPKEMKERAFIWILSLSEILVLLCKFLFRKGSLFLALLTIIIYHQLIFCRLFSPIIILENHMHKLESKLILLEHCYGLHV